MSKLPVFFNRKCLQRECNEHGVVMSLILDALNRSQAERGSESDVPGIETRHWVESHPHAGRWQRSLPWLALGLALLVIVWLLISRNGEPEEASATVSVPISAQISVEMGSKTNQTELADAEVAGVSSLKKETTVVAQAPAPAPVNNLAAAQRATLQESSTRNSAAVANLYGATDEGRNSAAVAPAAGADTQTRQQATVKPVAKPAENEQAIDIEKMVNLARREAENAELSEHPAKFLSQLSQQTKDQVPTIYYTQHDYSSTASQSSVTLNGKLVRVGGSFAGSIKLLEILPNSIVLSDKGIEFRLRALNSWINL